MRLWSLHPKYLDRQGLLAAWREALLAQKVLQGLTRGYRNHPQLLRFKSVRDPLAAISAYLEIILREACGRGYSFDSSRIQKRRSRARIKCTQGQLAYELSHLRKKLWRRDRRQFKRLRTLKKAVPHPLFIVIDGKIESWERQ